MHTLDVKRERFTFTNREGQQLAGALERPTNVEPAAFALFAHCFTCSKDIAAASRISRALAARGIGVVRFDFTGLGNSDGDFANTNFSSNVTDLIDAVAHMRTEVRAPSILIGHSLGGAAVLAAAADVSEAKAVVTIGSPADPAHVTHLFADRQVDIDEQGEADVVLGGRTFTIRRDFVENLREQRVAQATGRLRKALLVLHSPVDEIVDIDNASQIFVAAKHPKSFVSLDKADHLLSKKEDSEYVAQTIAAWASRYVATAIQTAPAASEREGVPELGEGEVFVEEVDGKFTQRVATDKHLLLADEPVSFGGADTGPSPYEFLLAALGACTSMTLRMYANRRKLDLTGVEVRLRHAKVHAKDCEECETRDGKVDFVDRELTLKGNLSAGERDKLLSIADRCPVHRSLESEVRVRTRLN